MSICFFFIFLFLGLFLSSLLSSISWRHLLLSTSMSDCRVPFLLCFMFFFSLVSFCFMLLHIFGVWLLLLFFLCLYFCLFLLVLVLFLFYILHFFNVLCWPLFFRQVNKLGKNNNKTKQKKKNLYTLFREEAIVREFATVKIDSKKGLLQFYFMTLLFSRFSICLLHH